MLMNFAKASLPQNDPALERDRRIGLETIKEEVY